MKKIVAITALLVPRLIFAQLNIALDDIYIDHNLMGMSVVAVCDGSVQHVYHTGLKDYTRGLPVDDSTMYRFASVSKLVTAMGLMKLYEQGAFLLDDDISDAMGYTVRNPYHPNVPITYRMVLSHTSSLQDGNGYNSFLSATYNSNGQVPDFSEYLLQEGDYFENNNWRTEVPGTYFAYTNAGYGLVGTLIEKLSGERFDQYMKNEILNPLGIAGSYNVTDIENIDNVAVIYRKIGGQWQPQADNYQGVMPSGFDLDGYIPGTNGILFGPQGGLRISALDLSKILLLHTSQTGGVLAPGTIALMHEPQWTYNGNNGDNYYGLFRRWGLGVHITTNANMGDIVFEDIEMLGHPGEAYGLISDMYFNTTNGSGFVFVTNGCFNGYQFGDYSAFYTVEEDVFNALYAHAIQSCISRVDEEDNASWLVYPNPANEVLHIKEIAQGDFIKARIFHSSGAVVLEQELKNMLPQDINISQLQCGIYHLQLITNNRSIYTRFEVMR